MIRISLGALAALAIAAMVGALALLAQPDVVEAQSQSASRAFQRTWAAPGGELRVTITARNYGAFGQVVETLPEGFTFVSASLPDTQIEQEAQVVRFNLFGDASFNYVVTVPSTEGRYTFQWRYQERRPPGTQDHRAHAVARRPAANPGADGDRDVDAARPRPRRNPRPRQPLSQRPRRSRPRHRRRHRRRSPPRPRRRRPRQRRNPRPPPPRRPRPRRRQSPPQRRRRRQRSRWRLRQRRKRKEGRLASCGPSPSSFSLASSLPSSSISGPGGSWTPCLGKGQATASKVRRAGSRGGNGRAGSEPLAQND